MRKLLTVIVALMLIATVAVTARSGDKYDLKKLIEWQNTIYLEGIADTSLTRSNLGNTWEEGNTEHLQTKQSVGYFEKEIGWANSGMQLIDEFRAVTKLPKVPFFTNLIMMDLQLQQRFIIAFGDTDSGFPYLFGGTPATASGIGLGESQYRSYISAKWTFGSSPLKYEFGAEIQMRLVFSGAGIASVRVIPLYSNKFTISKWLEIQANVEQTLRWDYTTNNNNDETDNSATRSNYNFDFRIGSIGLAGGGYHYLAATPKRAEGYNIGPVTLAWRIRSRYDLGLRHNRWKDTDPGADNDTNRLNNSTINGYPTQGIADDWKFRTEEDLWVNVLKSVNLIDLNVGLYHFLMMNSSYAYNWPQPIEIYQDLGVGVELILDQSFFIGARARMILNDWACGWGVAMNGNENAVAAERWYTGTYGTSSLSTGYTTTYNGYTYAAIPQGNGRIGPQIYIGYAKDAFEFVFNYTGLANFRTFDLYKDNFTTMNTSLTTSLFKTTGYWDWRNEIEAWVTWKW